MEEYKGWLCYEEIPDGWHIDKTAGSPLHGYEFITNGKSMLSGGKRALARVYKPALRVCTPVSDAAKPEEKKPEESKPVHVIDENYTRTVNELARKKFEQKLLADIRVDLMVCEIEGWNKLEYLEELKSLINGLGSSSNGIANNSFNTERVENYTHVEPVCEVRGNKLDPIHKARRIAERIHEECISCGAFAYRQEAAAQLISAALTEAREEATQAAADRNCGCCEGYFTHTGCNIGCSSNDADCRDRCKHRAAILGKEGE